MDFSTNIIQISATKYDLLEDIVFTKKSIDAAFAVIANWIEKEFNASFVDFYLEHRSNSTLASLLAEQRWNNKVPDAAMFQHNTGAISIPFTYEQNKTGFVLLGAPAGFKTFSQQQIEELKPISRIMTKTSLFFYFLIVREKKNELQKTLSHIINPDAINPGGERRVLTAIITGLRGFSSISEKLTPSSLVKVLNLYLNEMSQIIKALGGTIEKFEGDSIVAFFGAPVPMTDHAIRCCLAAHRIKKMEAILNEQLITQGLLTEPLFTRIGVNTGEMIIGHVGSIDNLEYTVIGNNLSVASRIENVNKIYGTSVLISESSHELVKDFFVTRKIGEIQYEGQDKEVQLYELVDEIAEKTSPYTLRFDMEDDEDDMEGLEEL